MQDEHDLGKLEQYREIFDATNEAIFLDDARTGRMLDVNEAMLRMYGYDSKEDVLQLTIGDLSAGDAPYTDDEAQRRVRLAIEEGPQVFEWIARRKNGETFWAEVSLSHATIAGEGRVIAVVRDISERKRMEESLHISMESVKHSSDAIGISTPEGVHYYQNRTFDELFGDIGDNPPATLYVDHEKGRQIFAIIQAGGQWSGEIEMFGRDKSILTILLRAYAVKSEQGNITGLVGVHTDITKRKRLEQSLLQSAERARRQRLAIAAILQAPSVAEANLPEALRFITQTVSELMSTSRVSVWQISDDQERLTCLTLYDATQNKHSASAEIITASLPNYYQILLAENRIVADDAQSDPRTSELNEEYLKPLGITSMLDSGILLEGRLIGVVCLEHTGLPRQWQPEEESFVSTTAAIVAQLISNARRRQAEEALAASEKTFKNIVRASPMGIYIYELNEDDQLIFSAANPAADTLTGVDNQAFIGKTIEEAFPPLAQTEFQERFKRAARDGESWNTEQIVYAHDNISGAFEVNVFQISPGKAGVLFNEISERMRTQDALRQSEEGIRTTLLSIADAVMAFDNSGCLVRMNPMAEKLSGWTYEEARGKRYDEVFTLLAEETRRPAENPVGKALASGETRVLSGHFILVSRDGSEYPISDSASPIRDASGRMLGVVLVFRDISEHRRNEKELIKAQRLESIGLLAGGIAHDFNNILMGVYGNLELASMDLPENHPVSQSIAIALNSVHKATHLTHQLLTFAKGGEPILESLRLDRITEEAVTFHLSGSRVKALFNWPDHLWPVKADKGQIHQVIANLTLNAMQAMPTGGTIHLQAENCTISKPSDSPLPPGNYVLLSLRDEGTGIPEIMLDHIFDPYFSTKQTGSGLGLSIVHSIITRHHGHIRVESTPDTGSTFFVYLPADLPEQEEKPATTTVAPPAPPEPGRRALVLDDDVMVQSILGRMLQRCGYACSFAQDGKTALEIWHDAATQGNPFDLAIMDLTIPGGMGGAETANKLLQQYPHAVMLVASGYSNDPVLADYAAYGFKGRLVKPFQLADLEAALEAALAPLHNS